MANLFFMFLLRPGKGVDAVVDVEKGEKDREDTVYADLEMVFGQRIGSGKFPGL